MLRKIYRREAIEYKKNHWKGKALLLAGMPAWIVTLPHSVNVFAPQQGFVVNQYVKVGEIVNKGQPLYKLDISRSTINGNVNTAQIEVIDQKIANAENIISKLSHNKSETLRAIEKQIATIKDSLEETSRMLINTQAGLNKMHTNLASYDKYLKDGLITKDQYNYQHSLYFQQQSAYQSLVSQKMQLETQLTQANSDKVTKAADFDNQISGQNNQINDFKNQLVESNANGNIIIKATIDGKIESLAVTKGQMVENGSSLAQIKPTGNIEYYLIIWLPNNAIPYIKKGDIINIRYDAFPADKFGQFPGEVLTLSSVPASRQEMAEYTNVSNGSNQQDLALYKAIIKIKNKEFNYNGKVLTLSNGLKAQAVVFLEERPLYMWMFTPFYKIMQSVSGPIDE